jgi:hypothetical protein
MVEYSEELWKRVLEEIAVGCTPGSIETIEGMPSARTILNWRKKSPEHMAQYDAAAKVRCVAFVEQAVDECRNSRNDMVDRLGYKGPEPRMEVNGEVLGRSRLICDILLRVAAIYEPKFAPKSRHEVVGKDDGPVQIGVVDILAEGRARVAAARNKSDGDAIA